MEVWFRIQYDLLYAIKSNKRLDCGQALQKNPGMESTKII